MTDVNVDQESKQAHELAINLMFVRYAFTAFFVLCVATATCGREERYNKGYLRGVHAGKDLCSEIDR